MRVQVKPFPYTVPYVITDEDGLTAMALIHVPTGESGLPFVVSGALIEMDKDSTKSVKLADYVKSPRGAGREHHDRRQPSAPRPEDRLRVEADGRSGLTLTSSGGYIGPGAVMLEVSDQETVDQKDFKTAYVSIPVQIGPKIPLLRCPDYAVTLNAGGLARTVDIPTLCHAWLPVGMTLDDVVFESGWKPEPKDVDLTQERRRVTGPLELQAGNRRAEQHRRPARGQGARRTGLDHRGVGVRLDGRRRSTPTATRCRSLGPPRLRPFSVSGLEAGSSRTVNLRAYLDSPLDEPELHDLGRDRPAGLGPHRLHGPGAT